MRKIKDLIYDYNDVFVALVIVIIAAGVLVWRVNVVMAYPDGWTAKTEETEEIDIDFSGIDLEEDEIEVIKDVDDANTGSGSDSSQTGDSVQSDDQTVTPDSGDTQSESTGQTGTESQTETGSQTEPVQESSVKVYTIDVSRKNKNTNWTSIGKELEANGIIATASALGKKAEEMGKDGSLQVGTFELSSDMTLEEMVKVLIKVPKKGD